MHNNYDVLYNIAFQDWKLYAWRQCYNQSEEHRHLTYKHDSSASTLNGKIIFSKSQACVM